MKSGYVWDLVGETPLIKIKSLSKETGCEIFGKAEFLNPSGSVKDRAAKGIIEQAEQENKLKPGFTIIEGTAGNTGIGLATLAAQRGYKCLIVMPNNQSQEKYQTLKALGVELVTVDPVPFSNQNHFYHTARNLAQQTPNSFWADQFENTANYKFHFKTTGPEIYSQMNGKIDYFVSAAGTGGTIAGVTSFLKSKNSQIKTVLVDPEGSGLYHHFYYGELKATGSSITEGIGIMRLTENYKKAIIDEAVQIGDQKVIDRIYQLSREDGLLVGTSAALNVQAAYEIALKNKNSGLRIVTILCDSGLRYQSRVFNPEWLKSKKLETPKL